VNHLADGVTSPFPGSDKGGPTAVNYVPHPN